MSSSKEINVKQSEGGSTEMPAIVTKNSKETNM